MSEGRRVLPQGLGGPARTPGFLGGVRAGRQVGKDEKRGAPREGALRSSLSHAPPEPDLGPRASPEGSLWPTCRCCLSFPGCAVTALPSSHRVSGGCPHCPWVMLLGSGVGRETEGECVGCPWGGSSLPSWTFLEVAQPAGSALAAVL